MKRIFRVVALTSIVILHTGCNMSENKEARIRKLENQNEQTATKLQELESRIESLESSQ